MIMRVLILSMDRRGVREVIGIMGLNKLRDWMTMRMGSVRMAASHEFKMISVKSVIRTVIMKCSRLCTWLIVGRRQMLGLSRL